MQESSADQAADASPDQPAADGPWFDLSPDGETLAVHDFLTTMCSQTSNALRRAITMPYAGRHGLTLAEWRVLSVLAHGDELPFAQLVDGAAADKAQVSRTLQLLAGRGLVQTQALGATRRHGTVCRMTDAGRALVAEVMPEARRSQAAMILTLEPEERRVLYRALRKLRERSSALAAGMVDNSPAD